VKTLHSVAIGTKLKIEGRIRNLAMFIPAIASTLRGCDVGSMNSTSKTAPVCVTTP
jgi:hypothetical protein